MALESMIAGLLRPEREAAPPRPVRTETAPTAPVRPATAVRERATEVARAPASRPEPSATTRQLNTGVSTTSRLNAAPVRAPAPRPVPASRPAAERPAPVEMRRADLPPPPPSGGPSFDCRRSRNAAERAICGDDRLAQMDVAMSRRYAEAQEDLSGRAAADLRAEQLEWLRRRDACETRRCLEMMYDTRAARLSRMY
jgi:hypothetical protein